MLKTGATTGVPVAVAVAVGVGAGRVGLGWGVLVLSTGVGGRAVLVGEGVVGNAAVGNGVGALVAAVHPTSSKMSINRQLLTIFPI
jgi:hypothetical protein